MIEVLDISDRAHAITLLLDYLHARNTAGKVQSVMVVCEMTDGTIQVKQVGVPDYWRQIGILESLKDQMLDAIDDRID